MVLENDQYSKLFIV